MASLPEHRGRPTVDISPLQWKDGWFYKGLRVQADPTAHCWIADYLRSNFGGGRVLDLATGSGALAQQLIDGGFDVECTSWDERSRADCPTHKLDLDFPFDRSSLGGALFDVVIACEIIEHVENPASFLRSCAALLDDGGSLVVTTPNVESSRARLQWLRRGYPQEFGPSSIRDNRHITILWRHGLEWMLEQAGFTIQHKLSFGSYRRYPLWRRTLLLFLELLASKEGVGTTRAYVATKRGTSSRLGPGEVY